MNWILDIDEERFEIVDAEHLRKVIVRQHEEHTERPAIALLTGPDGACLCIGLGLSQSVLNYIAPGGWPAQHSVGADVESECTLTYELAGQLSEIPARCGIGIVEAIEAAVPFFTTGELTQVIQWEPD